MTSPVLAFVLALAALPPSPPGPPVGGADALPAAAPQALAGTPAATSVPAPAGDPDGALASIEAFKAGTPPPVLERPGVTLVPFGYAGATLRCAPLRVCGLELTPGETVLHVATGDSERWAIQPAATGEGGRTPLLLVKPTGCNLTTNLIVTTDRHVYQVLLESPPCDEAAERGPNPHLPFTPLVRFYHPNEFVATWGRANGRAAELSAAVVPLGGKTLESLDFGYSWHAERRFPWAPAQVFDDGVHCYIHLPSRPKDLEAPVLAVLDSGGKESLLNYAVRGDYYVTDRTFERAVLLLGERRLVIERHR